MLHWQARGSYPVWLTFTWTSNLLFGRRGLIHCSHQGFEMLAHALGLTPSHFASKSRLFYWRGSREGELRSLLAAQLATERQCGSLWYQGKPSDSISSLGRPQVKKAQIQNSVQIRGCHLKPQNIRIRIKCFARNE